MNTDNEYYDYYEYDNDWVSRDYPNELGYSGLQTSYLRPSPDEYIVGVYSDGLQIFRDLELPDLR